jgi:VRR-NUC domain.
VTTTAEYQAQLARLMPEQALLNQVRALAHALGWLAYHTHRSERSEPGFPDLTLVKGDRLIFAELKTERGKTTGPQELWLAALTQAGAEVHLWRPTRLLDGTIETIPRSPK